MGSLSPGLNHSPLLVSPNPMLPDRSRGIHWQTHEGIAPSPSCSALACIIGVLIENHGTLVGMVASTCSTSVWEAKVQGQSGLQSKILSQQNKLTIFFKEKNKKKKKERKRKKRKGKKREEKKARRLKYLMRRAPCTCWMLLTEGTQN